MHPADLAAHRERRDQLAARALERDAARLGPRVDAGERLVLHVLCDAARRGDVPIESATTFVRARITKLDRDTTASTRAA